MGGESEGVLTVGRETDWWALNNCAWQTAIDLAIRLRLQSVHPSRSTAILPCLEADLQMMTESGRKSPFITEPLKDSFRQKQTFDRGLVRPPP